MPDRRPYLCLVAILATYVSGYALFPAGAFTSSDESAYVEQAVVFANGSLASVSPYPPGTSLLQSPFVAIAGWRAAPWLSLLALGATVLLMARWLRDAGYHPGFALLFLAYAPTLVMARVGTSEVPSAAMVTLGLWLFWTGQDARWKWGLAGWLAGLSILLRETNILLFLPFLTAATASRRPGWLVLASTAAAGLATAVLGYWLTAATLPGLRVTAGFSMDAVGRNIGIYAICMLVLAPGGLAAIATYKGRERRALTAAVAGYLAVYLFYDYSGQDSAPPSQKTFRQVRMPYASSATRNDDPLSASDASDRRARVGRPRDPPEYSTKCVGPTGLSKSRSAKANRALPRTASRRPLNSS